MKIVATHISAFITNDGKLFIDQRKADAHQQDLLGQMLDDFLPHDDRGNVTQTDRFNILMKMLDDKDLYKKVSGIYRLLTNVKNGEIDCE